MMVGKTLPSKVGNVVSWKLGERKEFCFFRELGWRAVLFFSISSIATQYPLSEYLSPMVKCPRNKVDSETIFRIFTSVGMSGTGDGELAKTLKLSFRGCVSRS